MPNDSDAVSVVYVVDDDDAMREALCMLLKSVNLPVQECSSAADFLECFRPGERGCVVLDVRMPDVSGFELFEILRRRQIAIPVIFVSAHGNIAGAVRAVKAGAFDFVEKPFDDQQLLDCIYRAIDRDQQDEHRRRMTREVQRRWETLTTREREVMKIIAYGMLSKQIAERLNISVRTVDIHRSRILQKMQAKSVADVVRMQILIDPSAMERDEQLPSEVSD